MNTDELRRKALEHLEAAEQAFRGHLPADEVQAQTGIAQGYATLAVAGHLRDIATNTATFREV